MPTKQIKEGVCPECGAKLPAKASVSCECGARFVKAQKITFMGYHIVDQNAVYKGAGVKDKYGSLLPATPVEEQNSEVEMEYIKRLEDFVLRHDEVSSLGGDDYCSDCGRRLGGWGGQGKPPSCEPTCLISIVEKRRNPQPQQESESENGTTN